MPLCRFLPLLVLVLPLMPAAGQDDTITNMRFLNVAIDGWGLAAGQTGVAGSGSLPQIYQNPAQIAGREGWEAFYARQFVEEEVAVDAGHTALGAAFELDSDTRAAVTIRRFTYGSFALEGADGGTIRVERAYEMSIGMALGRRFGERWAAGAQLHYLRGNFYEDDANSVALDLGVRWSGLLPGLTLQGGGEVRESMRDLRRLDDDAGIHLGAALLSMGPGFAYGEREPELPLPQRLRVGVAWQAIRYPHSHLRLYGEWEKDLFRAGDNFVTSLASGWKDRTFVDSRYHLGARARIFYVLTAAAGAVWRPAATGTEWIPTIGLGLEFRYLTLHMAQWLEDDPVYSINTTGFRVSIAMGGFAFGDE